MIVIKGLTKSYGDTVIFNNFSVKFDSAGKIYTILGESGSGKSTLLNILFGIDQEFTGNYWLFGKKSTELTESHWDQIRSSYVQILYQDYKLLEDFSVYDNLLMASSNQQKNCNLKIDEALISMDLMDEKYMLVKNLSGGQKQRLALARATINHPKILLLDEPTGSLDDRNTNKIMNYINKLKKQGLTILLITHDSRIIEHSDYIFKIKNTSLQALKEDDKANSVEEKERKVFLKNEHVVHRALLSYALKSLRFNIKQLISIYLPITMIITIFLLAFTAFQSQTLGSFNHIFNGIGKDTILINTQQLTNAKLSENNELGISSSFDGRHIGFSQSEIKEIKKLKYVKDVIPYNGTTNSFADKNSNVLNTTLIKDEFPDFVKITKGYARSSSNLATAFRVLEVPKNYVSYYNPSNLNVMFGEIPADNSEQLLISDLQAYSISKNKKIESLIGKSISLNILDRNNKKTQKNYIISGIYATDYVVEIPSEIIIYLGYFSLNNVNELRSEEAYQQYIENTPTQNEQTKNYEKTIFESFNSYSAAIGTGDTNLLIDTNPGKVNNVQKALAKFFPDLVLTSQYELKKGALSGTYKRILLILILGSSAIAIVLGIIVILITKSHISRKSKNMAILYSLGYSKKEVMKSMLYENGLIFCVITSLAYSFSILLYQLYLKYTPNYKWFTSLTSIGNLTIFLFLILIIFLVSIVWALNSIKRKKLIEQLK